MPQRLGKLAKALRAHGIQLEKPGSGSHYKFVDARGKVYPVPAHNGLKTEISDVYIRGVRRCFGLDNG